MKPTERQEELVNALRCGRLGAITSEVAAEVDEAVLAFESYRASFPLVNAADVLCGLSEYQAMMPNGR